MDATMIARTADGIVTGAMAAARPLPSALLTALYITPIALLPALQVLHRFTEAKQVTERISIGIVTEKPVNKVAQEPRGAAKPPAGAETI